MSSPQAGGNSNSERDSKSQKVPELRKRGEKYSHAADSEGESGKPAAELNLVHGDSAMRIGFIHTVLLAVRSQFYSFFQPPDVI